MKLAIFLGLCFLICQKDLKSRLIPDYLTLGGILAASIINYSPTSNLCAQETILGVALGAILMLLAGFSCFTIEKEPVFGGGDVKLMAMIGAFWGWKVVLLTFCISPMIGAIHAGLTNTTKNAYGVFIVFASLVSIFIYRGEIWSMK